MIFYSDCDLLYPYKGECERCHRYDICRNTKGIDITDLEKYRKAFEELGLGYKQEAVTYTNMDVKTRLNLQKYVTGYGLCGFLFKNDGSFFGIEAE